MDIGQFSHIDEVFALNENWKELKETGNITLMRSQGKAITFVDEFYFVFVNQTFEFIVLESIHQQLLVQSEPFII